MKNLENKNVCKMCERHFKGGYKNEFYDKDTQEYYYICDDCMYDMKEETREQEEEKKNYLFDGERVVSCEGAFYLW